MATCPCSPVFVERVEHELPTSAAIIASKLGVTGVEAGKPQDS
jgi:hypothetical protein